MLLKLRTQGNNKGIAWRILDDIKQIDYEYVGVPKEVAGGVMCIYTYPDLPNKKVLKIHISYQNGNKEIIYTDDTVYILNDDGKTCDTING